MKSKGKANDSTEMLFHWQLDSIQIVCLVTMLSLGAIVPVSSFGQEMGHNVWVSYVISIIAGFLYALILQSIMKLATSTGPLAISQEALGKVGGIILSSIFILMFFFLSAYYLNSIIYFWSYLNSQMDNFYLLAIVSLLLGALGAYMGIEVIGRVSLTIIVFIFLTWLMDTLIVIPEMRFDRFLPVGNFSWRTAFDAAFDIFLTQFLFLPFLLVIMPSYNGKAKRKPSTYIFLGLGLATLYYVVATVRNIVLLGDSIFLQYYVNIQALRMVDWNSAVIRMEVIGQIVIVGSSLVFFMLTYFFIANIGSELLKIQNYRKLILPLLPVFLLFIFFLFQVTNFNTKFIDTGIMRYMTIVFIFGILLIWLSLWIKKRKRKKREGQV